MSARGGNDPDRRERIVDAALAVIVERGVHDTTHRRIAARAGVPLGSLTYYFDGLSDILEAAFAALSSRLSAGYRDALEAASTPAEAASAVVDLVCGALYPGTDDQRAVFEMYSYGNFNPAVRELCRDWLAASRENLGLHFTEPTARALDALVEGWPMHQSWEGAELDRRLVANVVDAIVARLEPAPATRVVGEVAARYAGARRA